MPWNPQQAVALLQPPQLPQPWSPQVQRQTLLQPLRLPQSQVQLHDAVCWWWAPKLRRFGTKFVAKLLEPVQWHFDGFTMRGETDKDYIVRVCREYNGGHPDGGETFLALGQDLVAVQYGPGHN